MINEFPPGHILRVKILDTPIVLAGLATLAIPAVHLFFPGDIDTTVHVALGSLIVVCAAFRVLVAYGSAWLEIVLCTLGAFVFMLPTWMHMSWDPHYRMAHLAIGLAVIILSAISAILTFAQLSRARQARA